MRMLPGIGLIAATLLAIASPSAAQWTQVAEVPATDIFTVWAKGDTILAGGDSLAYVSTNAGVTWKTTTKVAAGATSVNAVRVRNGRLYAGTYGQGVFISDDLGDSWTAFSQGLSGGIGNSHLFIHDLVFQGDNIVAATSGAGAFIRNLAVPGTWSHFGNAFELNQASNMNGLATDGTRLLAASGFNGTAFFRAPGDPDWTRSWLNNAGILPGLAALSAAWTGQGWVMGTNAGVYRSATGVQPWTQFDPGLGVLFNVAFALRGHELYASFGAGATTVFEVSPDDGATWEELETLEFTFVYSLALSANTLYASRLDGLWRRPLAPVAAPPGPVAMGLRFGIAGAHPVDDTVRFRFELPEAGRASIDVFDLGGRRAAAAIEGDWSAGPHEVPWSTRDLEPGVYLARLSASGRQVVARLVRTR